MIFILNGVIRSMPNEEIEYELKKCLTGKLVTLSEESFLLNELSLRKNNLCLLIANENEKIIPKIKKMELLDNEKKLKVFTNKKNYFFHF